MSSEQSHFVLSSLALREAPGSSRLHSRGYTLFMRIVALMLACNIYRVILSDVGAEARRGVVGAIVEGTFHVAALFALVLLLWFRQKRVVATRKGLELGSGKKLRRVPWERVVDIREMPWIRFSPPWYPKLFQVDLTGGEAFDFAGVRNARQIVIEFVKRAESARDVTDSTP